MRLAAPLLLSLLLCAVAQQEAVLNASGEVACDCAQLQGQVTAYASSAATAQARVDEIVSQCNSRLGEAQVGPVIL